MHTNGVLVFRGFAPRPNWSDVGRRRLEGVQFEGPETHASSYRSQRPKCSRTFVSSVTLRYVKRKCHLMTEQDSERMQISHFQKFLAGERVCA
jgi:hypothetical protein